MAFSTDRIAVPTSGWTQLDSAPDADRNDVGSPIAGQGFAIKNTGTVQILIVDARQRSGKNWPLDPGEVFTVDLDPNDHVYGQGVGNPGEIAVAQVGVLAN